jgi:YVTN family beta-propeller protein
MRWAALGGINFFRDTFCPFESPLMRIRKLLFLPLLSLCFLQPAIAEDSLSYKLVKMVVLGSPERWDYLVYDDTSHRVFVAHGDHLSIVDGRSGAVIGEVGPFPGGTHGTAIVTARGLGYTDDGKAGVAGSFDLSTLKVTKLIPAEPDADGIVFDPASGHVFVTDGDSGHLTVIDPATNSAIGTISGGGGLEYSAVDGHGRLFVNGAEKNDLVAIDTATDTVTGHIKENEYRPLNV